MPAASVRRGGGESEFWSRSDVKQGTQDSNALIFNLSLSKPSLWEVEEAELGAFRCAPPNKKRRRRVYTADARVFFASALFMHSPHAAGSPTMDL